MSVADIDSTDDDKWLDYVAGLNKEGLNRLLVKSAGEGELWRVERLLERGADPEFEGGSALSVASVAGSLSVMNFLLQRGASQEARDFALSTAATSARKESVKLLLAHKADARQDNSVLLWYAAMNGETEIADMLLSAGADVNASNKALMGIALSRRNGDTALVFLRHGADPSAEFKGKNAFEWAAEMHMEDVFKKLRSYVDSDIYIGPAFFKSKSLEELRAPLEGHKGRSGFHVAAASGSFDIVVEKILAAPSEKLTSADLLAELPPIGPSVLVVLGQTGQLKEAFNPRLWAGRKQEMLDVFAKVPETYRAQVDIDSVMTAIDLIALKSRQRKLTLKP